MPARFCLVFTLFILLSACAPAPDAVEILATQTVTPAPSATPIPPTATPDLRVGGFIVLDGKIYAAADDGALVEQNVPGVLHVVNLSLQDNTLLALDESGAEAARYENGVWVEVIKGLSPEELGKLSLEEQKVLVPEKSGATVSGMIADQIGVYRDGAGEVVGYYDLVNNVELGLDDERLNEVKVEIAGTGFEGGRSLALIETIEESEDLTQEYLTNMDLEVYGAKSDGLTREFDTLKEKIPVSRFEVYNFALTKKELQRVILDDSYELMGFKIGEFNQVKMGFVHRVLGERRSLSVVARGLTPLGISGEGDPEWLNSKDFYEALKLEGLYRMNFNFTSDETVSDENWAKALGVKIAEKLPLAIGMSDGAHSLDELMAVIEDGLINDPMWMQIFLNE